MDPHYKSTYDKNGLLEIPDCGKVYYELRGTSNTENICLIMGAFATLRHYDELADFLASKGYRVLTYDHRGIGKSIAVKPLERQTSTMLARGSTCSHLPNGGREASVSVLSRNLSWKLFPHCFTPVCLEFYRLSIFDQKG